MLGYIERGGQRIALEPKLFDVLVCLAEHEGDVVSIDQLLEHCWAGDFYGDNPVHKAIAILRKALGDDARSPRYIATIRKRGYRLIAPVTFAAERPAPRAPREREAPWAVASRRATSVSADCLLDLARALEAVGRVLLRMGRGDVALEYVREALDLKRQVTDSSIGARGCEANVFPRTIDEGCVPFVARPAPDSCTAAVAGIRKAWWRCSPLEGRPRRNLLAYESRNSDLSHAPVR